MVFNDNEVFNGMAGLLFAALSLRPGRNTELQRNFFWILLPLHLIAFWKPPSEIQPIWEDPSAKHEVQQMQTSLWLIVLLNHLKIKIIWGRSHCRRDWWLTREGFDFTSSEQPGICCWYFLSHNACSALAAEQMKPSRRFSPSELPGLFQTVCVSAAGSPH